MHELSIALSIVDAAAEAAATHGNKNVAAVHLKLGPLSGIVKEALLFSFALACEGTSLKGSRLVIEHVPVVGYCNNCAQNRPIESLQRFECPVCSALIPDLVQGKELMITALEIEQ